MKKRCLFKTKCLGFFIYFLLIYIFSSLLSSLNSPSPMGAASDCLILHPAVGGFKPVVGHQWSIERKES